jgi:hypothetical protein
VTVFDPARITDASTYEDPAKDSRGIQHVLVNGVLVVNDGRLQESVALGKAVRALAAETVGKVQIRCIDERVFRQLALETRTRRDETPVDASRGQPTCVPGFRVHNRYGEKRCIRKYWL